MQVLTSPAWFCNGIHCEVGSLFRLSQIRPSYSGTNIMWRQIARHAGHLGSAQRHGVRSSSSSLLVLVQPQLVGGAQPATQTFSSPLFAVLLICSFVAVMPGSEKLCTTQLQGYAETLCRFASCAFGSQKMPPSSGWTRDARTYRNS